MMGLWRRWVELCFRPIDSRPLALVRVAVGACISVDLLRLGQLGLVRPMFTPYEAGGLSQVQDEAWLLHRWLGDAAGLWAYGVSLICMIGVTLGLGTRASILVGVLAYAQLGHCYPPGDRGIDRILRMVLLFLLFSGVHRRFSLDNLLLRRAPWVRVPAWPAQLILFSMVMVYLAAGLGKIMQQPRWLSVQGTPVLYRIVTDPLAAHLDPVFWSQYPLPFRVGSIATIVLELGALVLLTRWRLGWAAFGVFMHLGIYASMELGMFSWGMLAMYPVLLDRWVCRALDRLPATANPAGSEVGQGLPP